MNQEERDFVVEEPEESFETKSGKKKRKKKQNGFGKGFFAGVIVMALLSVVIFGVYEYVSGVSVLVDKRCETGGKILFFGIHIH